MGGSARAEIYGEGGSGGDGEEEERGEEEVVAVESKWTNISQMVALLFVTVARCRRRWSAGAVGGRTDGQKPRRRQNAIEENRGRFSPQIATGAREIQTCLTAPLRSPVRSLTQSLTHSLHSFLPSSSLPSLPQVT